MTKLSRRAFEVLRIEIERCASNDAIGKAEKLIVLKRLEKLRLEKGSPATLDELQDTLLDIYPQFSEKVVKQAVKVNRSPGLISKIAWFTIFFASSAGLVWVINLPYPMVRKPIAKFAPILLFPSYMNMDSSYRGAIDALGQAEQLLDNPTSVADIERGGEKVIEAKKHLDNLPVWFLGNYPHAYCNWFGCTWNFTFNEFQGARKKVARLQAVAFQNKNAVSPLETAQQELLAAKQKYKDSASIKQKEEAMSEWKNAINLFEQIPAKTLAAQDAQARLGVYKKEFDDALTATLIDAAQEFDLEAQKIKLTNPQGASDLWQQAINRLNKIPKENPQFLQSQKVLASIQVKYQTVANSGSVSYIEAAKQYAFAAATISQKPPHPATQWKQAAEQWDNAISQLKQVDVKDAGYVEAQKLIAQYQTNLSIVQARYEAEKNGQEILAQANEKIQRLIAAPSSSNQQLKADIQAIINQLESVNAGTTAYKKAQELVISAQKRLKKI